jgi:hypothetical protein
VLKTDRVYEESHDHLRPLAGECMNTHVSDIVSNLCERIAGKVVTAVSYDLRWAHRIYLWIGNDTEYASVLAVRSSERGKYPTPMLTEFELCSVAPFAVYSDDTLLWSTDDPTIGGAFDYEDLDDAALRMFERWLVGVEVDRLAISADTVELWMKNKVKFNFFPVVLPHPNVSLTENAIEPEDGPEWSSTDVYDNVEHQTVSCNSGRVTHEKNVIALDTTDEMANIHLPSWNNRGPD